MPNIKPISDLRNYNDVLREVAAGQPVFLTENGQLKYAVVDIAEYEHDHAVLRLLSELAEGEHAGHAQGWLTLEQVEAAVLR